MADALAVQAGKTFNVVLTAYGGTGYSWYLVPSITADLKPVTLISSRAAAADVDVPGEMPRVGGLVEYRFTFDAEFAGEQQLTFVLTRPWEADLPWEAPAAQTHTVNVRVIPRVQRGGVEGREVA